MPDLLILLPLYNDWAAAAQLLARIAGAKINAEVLIVNDGSTQHRPQQSALLSNEYLSSVRTLHLRRNIGHQRAIASGLVYAYQNLSFNLLLIMDADGEDRPEDIPELLAAEDGSSVVFASRVRRSESLLFRLFYNVYRLFHRLATGIPVRVGNFSLLPRNALESLVVSADLWNHYAAAVFRTNLPRKEVPCGRGTRFAGDSKMNFISLVVHGISALSVFADVISTRLLACTSFCILLCLIALAFSGTSHLGAALILLILIQLALTAGGFCFLIISGRSQSSFLPLRDCPYFFSRVEQS